jgi:enoyl-CoA hydratase/carnithine racemase
VSLNRPERRNAIDTRLLDSLLAAFAEPDAQAVVLGSESPNAFCAGLDRDLSVDERRRVSDGLYELYQLMLDCDAVVVATLNGHVVGGGFQLALASDVRIAGPATRLRLAGPGHGLAVGAWGLPSLVGRGRALELCLSMRAVDADEALRIGLVDRLDAAPGEAATGLARDIAALDADAARRCKRIVGRAAACSEALVLERQGNAGWSGQLAPAATGAQA